MKRGPLIAAAAVVAITAISAVERWHVLAGSPWPLGVDGYYYPIQLRALLEDGALVYPSAPLALWLMLPFAAGLGEIAGAKLAAAVLCAVIALPSYAVGARLGRGRDVGVVTAALATLSAGSFYLSIEFVKNGIALVIAVAAVWLVLVRPRWWSGLLGVVVCALSHKMAVGVFAIIAVPALVAGRSRWWWWSALVLGVGGGVAIAWRYGLLGLSAEPTLPVIATDRGAMRLDSEPIMAAVSAVAAAIALRRRTDLPPHLRGAGWGAVTLAAVIALPWLDVGDRDGLAMRLRCVAYLPLALCAALAIGWVTPTRNRSIGCVVGALVLVLRVLETRSDGRVTGEAHMISAVHQLIGRVPEGHTVVIADRQIAYQIAWYVRVAVALNGDNIPPARRLRVMTRAEIGEGSTLYRRLIEVRDRAPVFGLHARDPNGLIALPEATWQLVR